MPEIAWKMTGAGKGSLSELLLEFFCGVDGAEPFFSAGTAATSASSYAQQKIIQNKILKVKNHQLTYLSLCSSTAIVMFWYIFSFS